MDNSTTFTNRLSVKAYESKHQCKIHVRPHKTKEGIYLYYHSDAEDASAIGLVSQRAVDLLSVEGDSAWDKLMIADCHYIDNTGKQQTCKMLMLSNLKMNTKAYPLISEYVEAIKLAQDNLDKLSYLRPVLDVAGNPIMSSGNFAVVFKMKDERNGELHALKCFIKEQEGRDEAYKLIADELEYVSSDFITPIKYLEKELFVDTNNSDVNEFPVLLMDWEEGVTLDKYIREHLHDQYALHLITFQFCRLASWLMAQSFAHGDLKPDNILVKEDGSLVLVDYDGMFVPAMKGQKAREMGSPDYRHPLRTVNDFNEHIDDFSLATIAMQLYAIAIQPSLLSAVKGDTLLLTEADYRRLDKSQVMPKLLTLVSDTGFSKLLGLFFISFSENSLSKVSFRAFNINKPTKLEVCQLSTEVTDKDITNGVKDEFEAVYSPDWKRLLRVPNDDYFDSYGIRLGTEVICDGAFSCDEYENEIIARSNWTHIIIPESVTHIGNYVFDGCWNLYGISIPSSVTHIGLCIFPRCSSLITIQVSSNNKVYDSRNDCNAIIHTASNTLIACCTNTIIPDTVTQIGEEAFLKCYNLTSIHIPNSVTHIGKNAFVECSDLTSIHIPDSVTHIGEGAFAQCDKLTDIALSKSVTHIEKGAFSECRSLTSIIIPDSVTHIGEYAFSSCYSLTHISIPKSVTHIGRHSFAWCGLNSIQVSSKNEEYDSRENCNAIIHTISNKLILGCINSVIPNSVTHIGDGAFIGCSNLTSIHIPDSVTHIGDSAFCNCRRLNSITIPDSVTYIGDHSFCGCSSLNSITIPDSVTHIGGSAFMRCYALTCIHISNSVTYIGASIFRFCSNLTAIVIPNGSMHKFQRLLEGYDYKLIERDDWLARVTEEEISNGVKDEFGAVYSHDGKRLLKGANVNSYSIRYGTNVICKNAFHDFSNIQNVKIPDSVTRIGNLAFRGCTGIERIKIPSSITIIKPLTFYKCIKLQLIDLPNTITIINASAFRECKSLHTVLIPNSVTRIDNAAFMDCSSLESIIIPNSVTHIGKRVFSGCCSLRSATLPNSVTQIGAGSFNECSALVEIRIPNGSYDKFNQLLPDLKDKFVMDDNLPLYTL